jgi:GT2 family glycosyltransferase
MITASIVIYNSSKKDLHTIITCVANSIVQKIYVIDNALDNRFKDFAQSMSDKVIYIHGQGNIGFGAAHNIALREAIRHGVIYHLVVNPDIEFQEGIIEQLTTYMDENHHAGLITPKIVYPTGELQYVCNLIPTPFDLLCRRFILERFCAKRLNKFQLKFTGYNTIMNVPYIHGCFLFFRVTALKEIGLFDERFFMYPEDIDITRRINEKYATIFYPGVKVVHTHAAESRKSLKMLRIHTVNLIRYFNKWGWFFDRKRRETNKKVMMNLNNP